MKQPRIAVPRKAPEHERSEAPTSGYLRSSEAGAAATAAEPQEGPASAADERDGLDPSDVTPALTSGAARARLGSRHAPVLAWLGLLLLWLLFELPTSVAPDALVPGAMRPTLDVLVLLTLWGGSHFLPGGVRPVRRGLACVAAVLFAFRLDQMIFMLLMRDEPLLYDQWFMVKHLFVLIGDLMSPRTVLIVGAFVLGISVCWMLMRRFLRAAGCLFTPEHQKSTLLVGGLLWAVALVGLLLSVDGKPLTRTLTPAIAANVGESMAIYASIQRGVESSPYASYDNIALKSRPDVLFFVVESYGRILSMHADTQEHHGKLLSNLEQTLGKSGWHMVSTFSRSSVSGGRSWLAEGTILMGTPVRYEAVFNHLVSQRVPNFVGFLRGNGYESVMLAPADRDRPGVRTVNRYGFDRIIGAQHIDYRGPAMGWGVIPDQFSLQSVQQQVLDNPARKRPLFFDFHMVTSHAPWAAVPPLVHDANLLNRLKSKFQGAAADPSADQMMLRRLRRFEHDSDGAHPYMSELTEPLRRGYQATITYDLQVLARYLEQRKKDAFVVILGDHQPPVITKADASFDTPVHVLSRDPALLAELLRNGFTSGLRLPRDAPAGVAHAGLFSLFVRTLASASSVPAHQLPRVMPEGQQLFARHD